MQRFVCLCGRVCVEEVVWALEAERGEREAEWERMERERERESEMAGDSCK